MRTLPATTMLVVMLASLLTTSGCLVLKSDLDRANSHNLRLQEQIGSLRDEIAQLDAQKRELAAELYRLQAGGGTAAQISALEVELQTMQNDYDDLLDRYRALVEQGQIALPPTMNLALEQLAAQHSDMIEFLPDIGMVKFTADLTFPKGQDTLQPAAATALQQLARIVGSVEAQGFNVYIAGHTDDIPIKRADTLRRHPNNWYLSVHRAVVVEEALESAGIDPERMAIMGFGEYRPTAANAPNQQGNPANRRVEIWIVPPGQFVTGR